MNSSPSPLLSSPSPSWSSRYGERHRLERITNFPHGIAAPQKVRLYRRRDHYVLQWWDPRERRTLSDRVDGDLVAAIARARELERRMVEVGRSGVGRSRLTIAELIDLYLKDAGERAASGEIDLRTVARYRSALEYLRQFSEQPTVARTYSHAASIDRRFVLEFGTFLQEQLVSPNGHTNSVTRQMRGQHYVVQSARSAFSWAADPERGNLLPAEFRSPFQQSVGSLRRPTVDLTREPPITIAMAAQFIGACDGYQFRLFLPLILFGLRASEPMWLFQEDTEQGWLNVQCHPELDYQTKGRRDKRFPLLEEWGDLWDFWRQRQTVGLLLKRREHPQRSGVITSVSYTDMVSAYQHQCRTMKNSIAVRREIRDRLLDESGGINYDQTNSEFRRLAKGLDWKPTATLKGFRHLFATALENSGCPETYRRYFLGHSPGRAASVNYTHLDQLQRHFQRFLQDEYADIVTAFRDRLQSLMATDKLASSSQMHQDDRKPNKKRSA